MTAPITPNQVIHADKVTAIVELACRAPSLHNSQPWKWLFDHGELQLFADHSRVGRHTDVTGNEVIMSCGAALDHLQVAARAAGWKTHVERYPDAGNRDHLATITFHSAGPADDHELALRDAISTRHTDRLPMATPEPWNDMEQTLRNVLRGTVTELDVIDDSGRPALADASRRSEAQRRDDASYRYELLWWTHHVGADDGIPPAALGSPTEVSRVDVAREFPSYTADDRRPGVDRDHSNVLVLSTFDDSRMNILRCGEALSRVLLECTAARFSTCPLTHMMEVHASREAVRRLTGRRAQPQALIRVGLATGDEAGARTPRRPVSDVLTVR
ncbi:NAD(P)H nitroreductase [Mycolicibacterium agri]|uniref:NAD(P)H nitroreductase n=1 Tax=Mycolicibacterium agri TaxID=36811 RepID=A0A2A7MT16_MYCAG|nr:NAD(P)H nitroreductase [Mycolicibacterium agri]PEG34826.1 NAD(P)H nitroreductase [Mycolicibacterium agri]GFG50332.1 hypothetical protein MAGR_17730 [Mycolicibacterium agri]